MTIRLPEGLRRKIRKMRHVNWSQVARKAIEERAEFETANAKTKSGVSDASRTIDHLFEELDRRYGRITYDSAETIRSWREARYRYSS